MDELIIRKLQGRTTAADDQRLAQWRRASSANEQSFHAWEQVWQLAELGRPEAGHGPVPTAQQLISRARRQVARDPSRSTGPRGNQWARAGVAAGVAAALTLVAAGLWSHYSADVADRTVEFVTGPGEFVTIQMGDGTILRLGPESRVRATDASRDRGIWLEGHAFLAVADQDGAPFRVRTRLGDASVLGTRFDMHVRDNRLQLVVVDGRVSLASADGAGNVEVKEGQTSLLEQGGLPTVRAVTDLSGALEWLGRGMFFQSTPLDQVAREIERLYGIRVRLTDPSLASRTVTAWFTDQSFEQVVSAVCRVVNARCTVEAGSASIGS
jgi:transmembrane sensor